MTCRYFDPRPKDDRALMYGRDSTLKDVADQLEAGFWTLVVGPKRIGKTSVLKVISGERGGLFLDVSTCITVRDLGDRIIDAAATSPKMKLIVDLKLIKAEFEKRPLRTLEQFLNDLGNITIALDEVQNLNDPAFTKLLSVAYNESKVTFMFSGSAIGMIKRLSNDLTMLGRPTQQVDIEPFDAETSKGFLRKGFEVCSIAGNTAEIDETIGIFGGIPGWLTYYGAKRYQKISHDQAVREVKVLAKGVLKKEVKKLGPLERALIKALASLDTGGTWTELKALSRTHYRSKLHNTSLTRSIDSLINLRLLRESKTGVGYEFVDPTYKLIR